MLAQNFKTAAELGIDGDKVSALVKVLGMMERGEISEDNFCMLDWTCGTVACIGGWAERMGSPQFGYLEDMPKSLARLVYPDSFGMKNEQLRNITRAQAAHALRNYLTLGEARWAKILAPRVR